MNVNEKVAYSFSYEDVLFPSLIVTVVSHAVCYKPYGMKTNEITCVLRQT